MFRQAEPKDAEAIGKVRVAAWRAAYRQFLPVDFLEALSPADNLSELKERLASQNSEFMLSVAEEGDKVVAFSILGKPRYETTTKTIELWAVNVIPEWWRKGLGSGLVERAISYSSRSGFEHIELWCIKGNIPAETAYRKLGFVESGRERATSQLTGTPLNERHYTKPLLSHSNTAIDCKSHYT